MDKVRKNKIKPKKAFCKPNKSRERVETYAISRGTEQTFDFMGILGNFLGWKFCYEWTWRKNLKHWITLWWLGYCDSQMFYTQVKHFINGDYKKIYQILALVDVSISCVLRVVLFWKSFKRITALHNFSLNIIRQAGRDAAEQLDIQQLRNLKLCKFIVLITGSCLLIYVYHPIKSFILKGEFLPLMPIEFMFIDQTQLFGFLTANVLMSVMGLYTVFVSIFTSLNFYVLILNYSIQVDLIEYDIRQLDAFWGNTKKTSLLHRHLFLRNICQKCQDKDNYIDEVKKIFDNTIYIYFVAVYISQIICLYEIKVDNWVPGYGIAYGMFVELLFHCLFGTKVEIVNDRLYYVLTQSNWYTYDLHSQKIFLNLLNSCMNSNTLWIGPLAPLSVITGIQILKSVYSYYTVLAEVA